MDRLDIPLMVLAALFMFLLNMPFRIALPIWLGIVAATLVLSRGMRRKRIFCESGIAYAEAAGIVERLHRLRQTKKETS